ncbi:hypothetical protein OG349_17075 [Streptomyces sp. NBC_01317]|uniref:hypothetical protein n=1 Tax=Streptomyces sp. NBC_01317 TaxID=2903822 RepID=UPI002E122C1C|nr:hypothetical protein OG349_17075 [Streptomyces sp. NBC_01317]
MAPHFENSIPSHLLMWQRVREYAVPPSMIEIATARRAAGDWAGACAAARVDIDLDLRAVRDRHGTEFAARLRADLRRLAPDLLRWHLPRSAPDGRLRTDLTISLVRYGSSRGGSPQLVVRTPPAWADAGQRVSLALWEESGSGTSLDHARHSYPHPYPYPHPHPPPHPHPHRRFRLDLHRHLWDAERSGELAWRCGAGTAPDYPWASTSWAAEAEVLLRAEGRPRGPFTVRLGTRSRAVLELVAPDDSHAPTFRPLRETLPPQEVAALPVLPEAAARVLPDLELLRNGLIAADRLHPLVAKALAARTVPTARTAPTALDSGPSSGSVLLSGPAPASGPVPAHPPGDPHRVECRGEVHRIALRDGTLTAVDHHPAQLRREELLVAFGGPPLPCLRAIDRVHRDPEALPAVRERLGHGDIAGALAVVEGLLGPGAILRDGPLREELESAADRRIDHGLFRSGLAAAHPGAGAAAGGKAPDLRYAEANHRPRLDRRTPASTRLKQSRRNRPRTTMP